MLEYLVRRSSLLLGFLLLNAAHTCVARTIELTLMPRVDQRVELLSVIFRLAGNSEYNSSPLSGYTANIDHYFSPHKNHPAVLLARRLAQE